MQKPASKNASTTHENVVALPVPPTKKTIGSAGCVQVTLTPPLNIPREFPPIDEWSAREGRARGYCK